MDIQKLFWYFDGRATGEETAQIKAWVEESSENAREFRAQRAIYDALCLSSNGTVATRTSRGRGFRTAAFAFAAAAVAFCIGFFGFNASKEQQPLTTAMQEIYVPKGQRVNLSLPDGTVVWLNAGARLSYPISFMQGHREVTLDGEAFFDVAHDETSPFTVKTYCRDITVLGTSFDVDASEERGVFETALFDGKVRIDSGEDSLPIFLVPGEKATLSQGNILTSRIEDNDVYSWKDGYLCFTDKTFASVLESIERYYDVNVVKMGNSLDNTVLTGKFRISDGPDHVMKVLQRSVIFNYSRVNDTYYIK